MSTLSNKLKLIIPSLNDEVQQTILDLAFNFQKLDDASNTYAIQIPTSGFYKLNEKVWNSNPQTGQYVGWVNTREGRASPKWTPLYAYNVGDFVVPNVDNGHYYECIQAGRSGVNEPTFLTNEGSLIEDTKNGSTWQPSKVYNLYDVVFPTLDNNRFYVCTVAGTSGSNEPNWSLIDGGTVDDNMVVWTGYRKVIWQEKGIACNFKPFGKIE
ncbi:hypothetical protein [Paenibacillus naphthalenovorans]|uniref:Uncharacterized protein n=1 Tax=Paenibacillus naphthalenovorans TaxID=162209 RepID=A0A0U2W7A2_9BACL|nr:hypothetical protein [Paenibacillus naphthalenovorans]ALS22318.1 hypothetical protein IJ22_19440 [Paenibacillus naphthalenovorans]